MADLDRMNCLVKYLDFNYYNDAAIENLSAYDINNPDHQMAIIKLAMEDELSGTDHEFIDELKSVLNEIPLYPEEEVRKRLESVDMLFEEPLRDYIGFFRKALEYLSLYSA